MKSNVTSATLLTMSEPSAILVPQDMRQHWRQHAIIANATFQRVSYPDAKSTNW